ncbi:replication-associated protein [Giant house spider associated circular virus 1]|uniref:Replication-associated protein n=1 Tax=Giant house spider associated circular virus 1 TaxID=2293288 RepID=A0A346BP82_9VIRU|nr:replication-associated protein [Giant house spider associated circular virus 1]AXL65879.1 replication-associated protein [Giant house spider associated circular virus 1]
MSFRFNHKYVLLTYAQCGDLDGFAVMEKISSLGAECIVAREHHEDGGVHLHVFCEFERKFRSRRADVFDVDGVHPNIEPSKGTPEKGYDYAIKDGDVICGGLARPSARPTTNGNTFDKWSQITSAESRDEFWSLVHELDPKSAACNHSSLVKYCDWKYRERIPDYKTPAGISFDSGGIDGRDSWLQQSGIGLDEPLVGKLSYTSQGGIPPTGKTLWARSLGAHIYCVGMISGDECIKTDVDYAIFDDIRGGIKFFPSFKEWLGCQQWITVKRLYREPKLRLWGKPSIWISNTDPRNEMLQSDVEWMNLNCTFIEVNSAIFHANIQ